jgi:phenylacetate-CoA ligase
MNLPAVFDFQRQARLTGLAKRLHPVDSLIRYHPIYNNKVRRTIAAFHAADAIGRRRLSQQLERRMADRAAETEYGRRLAAAKRWPILDKATVRSNPTAFRAPVGLAVRAATGGTTGEPMELWRSVECVAAERAFIDHMLATVDLSFRTSRVAVLRGDNVKDPADEQPPFGTFWHGGRRLMLSAPHLSRKNIQWFVEALQRFQPELLWVYPSPLANFVRLVEEAGARLEIPFVVASSEVMPPATADAARSVLSSTVIDYYGLAERTCYAWSFRPREYWFSPAYGKVELIPDYDAPPADDGIKARIVATGYWNAAMPLMRYDTGDRAIVPAGSTAADLEEIALGLKPFVGIDGRSSDFIMAPGGRCITALNHIGWDVRNALRLQLIQHSETSLTIKVLATSGFGPADQQKILKNARLKIPPSIDVAVAVVDRLETLPSGKTPYILKQGNL